MMPRCVMAFCFFFAAACTVQDEHLVSAHMPAQQDFVQQGWESFQAGDFSAATQQFQLALAGDAASPGANCGLSWLLLFQSPDSATAIEAGFGIARNDPRWQDEALTGLVMLYAAAGRYVELVAAVDTVLQRQPQYQFPYRASIDWHDLQVAKSQALYNRGDYAGAWQSLQQIAPESPIDPNQPTTWWVNGREFWAFPPALAKMLELMTEEYREKF